VVVAAAAVVADAGVGVAVAASETATRPGVEQAASESQDRPSPSSRRSAAMSTTAATLPPWLRSRWWRCDGDAEVGRYLADLVGDDRPNRSITLRQLTSGWLSDDRFMLDCTHGQTLHASKFDASDREKEIKKKSILKYTVKEMSQAQAGAGWAGWFGVQVGRHVKC